MSQKVIQWKLSDGLRDVECGMGLLELGVYLVEDFTYLALMSGNIINGAMAQTESNIEENVVSATIEEISACNPSEEDLQLSETLDNVQEELILLESQLGRTRQELAFAWVFLVVISGIGIYHLLISKVIW